MNIWVLFYIFNKCVRTIQLLHYLLLCFFLLIKLRMQLAGCSVGRVLAKHTRFWVQWPVKHKLDTKAHSSNSSTREVVRCSRPQKTCRTWGWATYILPLGDRENENEHSGLGVMLELHEINGSTCLVNSKANKQDGHCCLFHMNILIFYFV